VQRLSYSKSKDAQDYLLELLGNAK